MQISVLHMNSRSSWYLTLRNTKTVLLVQQNSGKGRLLFFYMYLQRMLNFTKQDRRGKRNPSATAEVFSNIPVLQLSHSNIQYSKTHSAASEKDQVLTPAVKPQCPFSLHLQNYFSSNKIHLWTSEGICQHHLPQKEGPSGSKPTKVRTC